MNDCDFDPKQVRLGLGLNQQEFWARIGVAQSSGSRYEHGRRMPFPVQEMLRIVHIEGIDLSRINRGDFDPGGHLKFLHPWPGQTPPPLAAGRGDFIRSNRAWQSESVAV